MQSKTRPLYRKRSASVAAGIHEQCVVQSVAIILPWKLSRQFPSSAHIEHLADKISAHVDCKLITPSRKLENQKQINEYLSAQAKELSANGYSLVCCDPSGTEVQTEELGILLLQKLGRKICFCIGGSEGLPEELSRVGGQTAISLSRLVLAHEVAAVVLLEQLYRIQWIGKNHPYHRGEPSAFARSLKRQTSR